jgi:hypothetical protein
MKICRVVASNLITGAAGGHAAGQERLFLNVGMDADRIVDGQWYGTLRLQGTEKYLFEVLDQGARLDGGLRSPSFKTTLAELTVTVGRVFEFTLPTGIVKRFKITSIHEY